MEKDEWIQKYQEIRKAHDGVEATREEALEALAQMVQFCELLMEAGKRDNWKIPSALP